MAAEKLSIADMEKEGIKFLMNDFAQCFQQLRHYDGQIVDLSKFAFAGYTAILGTATGLYQFAMKEGKDFTVPIALILASGLVFGVFLFALVIRNRVYFVQVARYINEQRGLFLDVKPLGFQNRAGMYTNPHLPPFFNWRSSQAWYSYIIAAFNSLLLYMLVFTLAASFPAYWRIIFSCVAFAGHLSIGISYLVSRESKTTDHAVFNSPTPLIRERESGMR
jgi:hypothetical protein